ncbi:MAG: pilus assembly protein PilM [Bdellovibrionales bacterium]|nr:pilus assembly protein PilM [Bdellovibrionales bacterium]
MRTVGIDIGRFSIKVVEVNASNRSYEITNIKEYKILNPQTNDLEIDILQTLKTISQEFDTDSAKVVTSIRQQFVTLRKLFFPFREKAKIQKSLAFELEDEIPLPIDKAVYDSKILKIHDNAAEVIAMACVVDEVERTIDIFNRAGIDPDIIAPEFSAVANLYEKWYRPPVEVKEGEAADGSFDKLVVFLGHAKSFAGVVRNNQLIWGRSTLWGMESVASHIARAFQVPFMESLKMMPSKSFLLMTNEGANADQIKMSDAVASSLQPLLQSLRLTCMLADTEYGTNINSIELVGPGSKIKNLGPFITQALEIRCNPSNPMDNFAQEQVRGIGKLKDTCHFAFGLAIEGLKRPINPAINFRQGELAKKNLSFEKFWEKWGYTGKLIMVAYFCYFAYGFSREIIANQLDEASYATLTDQASKVANLKGNKASPSRIRAFIKAQNKKAELVKNYAKISDLSSPVTWLQNVSQILPNNKTDESYEVRQFIVNNGEVTVQGVAKDQEAQNKLLKAFKGVATAGKVDPIPATIKKESGKLIFAYKFNIKRKN